tara:strand:- start:18 stop:218 length:201 start_codon:yes stop_codon:yes gene_type:complete
MGFYTFIWYIYLFIWSYFIEMAKMAVYLIVIYLSLFSYLGLFDKVAKNGGIFMLIYSLLFGLFIWV